MVSNIRLTDYTLSTPKVNFYFQLDVDLRNDAYLVNKKRKPPSMLGDLFADIFIHLASLLRPDL
jgi:hypothetical protein